MKSTDHLYPRYSTGKTSLIKWVTGIESPFFDIRPQPSTDKFMAVVHGDEANVLLPFLHRQSELLLASGIGQEKVINGDAATWLSA